jgi:hypothetical protein
VITPNTFVLGGQKCGSTWLASRLAEHPDVFMARQEIHFFDKDYNYSKGLQWYSQFFAQASGSVIIAEKTPEYLWAKGQGGKGRHCHCSDVHVRVHRHFPGARFIVVLRDPVRRALSAVNHVRSYGYVPPMFSTESILFGRKRNVGRALGLLEKGLYADMLEPYFDLFPRDKFLILSFEEGICRNPTETMASVCNFLGLPPFDFKNLEERENQVRASLPSMWLRYYFPRFKHGAHFLDTHFPAFVTKANDSLKDRLTNFYSPHNERLFALLGDRFIKWSSK